MNEEEVILEQKIRYKYYVSFVALIAMGLAVLFIVTLGYYPIVFVNNHFISQHEFMREYAAASRYYQNISTTYKPFIASSSPETPADIETAVLNLLIDKNLIHDGASHEAGSDLFGLVQNKIGPLAGDTQLATAAQSLYGFTYAEFHDEILVPQAEEEVLSGRLFAKGEKIEDWLASARKFAHVVLLSRGYSWDGTKIVANN